MDGSKSIFQWHQFEVSLGYPFVQAFAIRSRSHFHGGHHGRGHVRNGRFRGHFRGVALDQLESGARHAVRSTQSLILAVLTCVCVVNELCMSCVLCIVYVVSFVPCSLLVCALCDGTP